MDSRRFLRVRGTATLRMESASWKLTAGKLAAGLGAGFGDGAAGDCGRAELYESRMNAPRNTNPDLLDAFTRASLRLGNITALGAFAYYFVSERRPERRARFPKPYLHEYRWNIAGRGASGGR